MKSKININFLEYYRPNKPKEITVENITNQLWNKYSKDLSTTGSGERLTKNQFQEYLRAYYTEYAEQGYTRAEAMKKAVKSYQMSNYYVSPKERLTSFTLKDYFGESKENRYLFQRLTRKDGRFTKFDPQNIKYESSGYIMQDGKKRHYTVDSYNGIYIVIWQSPEEKDILDPELYEDYYDYLEELED